jgi:hypothetical protein
MGCSLIKRPGGLLVVAGLSLNTSDDSLGGAVAHFKDKLASWEKVSSVQRASETGHLINRKALLL